jgi:mono/diheme cytochrome c family protein
MRKNSLVLLFALSSVGLAALGQTTSAPQSSAPQEYKIPPEAVKQANPVKPTPESLAEGKKQYGYDCAMCHGASGDGKGDLASDMKTPLGDFRDSKTLPAQTDGELFYIIKNGKGDMPAEGDRAKPNQVWNMVNYVRSLAKKDTTQSAEKK